MDDDQQDDVVIVGPCAAGKSTLTKGLRSHGFKARAIAQEHSGVTHLWRKNNAKFMIYLDVDLPSVHRRGRPNFPAWIHETQKQRLSQARQAADLYINTVDLAIADVLTTALDFLAQRGTLG